MIKYQVLILELDSIKSVKQHVGYAYVFLVDHLTTRPSYQQVFLLLPLSKNLVKIFEMIHVMLTRYKITTGTDTNRATRTINLSVGTFFDYRPSLFDRVLNRISPLHL